MQIQIEQTGKKGTFFIEKDETRAAEMIFTLTDNHVLIINHTEVSDSLRGTGAGKRLVAEAVAYARMNHLKVLPLCPYTKSVLNKTPEYGDVLSK